MSSGVIEAIPEKPLDPAQPPKPKTVDELVKEFPKDPDLLMRAMKGLMEAFRHHMVCLADDAKSREEDADSEACTAQQVRERAEKEQSRAEDDGKDLIDWAVAAGAHLGDVIHKIRNEALAAYLQRKWVHRDLERFANGVPPRPSLLLPLPPPPKPKLSIEQQREELRKAGYGATVDRALKLDLT